MHQCSCVRHSVRILFSSADLHCARNCLACAAVAHMPVLLDTQATAGSTQLQAQHLHGCQLAAEKGQAFSRVLRSPASAYSFHAEHLVGCFAMASSRGALTVGICAPSGCW